MTSHDIDGHYHRHMGDHPALLLGLVSTLLGLIPILPALLSGLVFLLRLILLLVLVPTLILSCLIPLSGLVPAPLSVSRATLIHLLGKLQDLQEQTTKVNDYCGTSQPSKGFCAPSPF